MTSWIERCESISRSVDQCRSSSDYSIGQSKLLADESEGVLSVGIPTRTVCKVSEPSKTRLQRNAASLQEVI